MVIEACQKWVEEFVIGHNLCPFALPFARKKQIEYHVSTKESLEERLEEFFLMLDALDVAEDKRTTLLIYDDPTLDFTAYLDLYALCEELLEGEQRAYQLASFHPDYCFEGEAEGDPANLSNRSPYPMIHILRLDDVHQAIKQHKDTYSIPERNIAYLREKFSSS